MRFLLLKREGAPVFTAYIRVKVGGIDEVPGKTGIAHLLEHMAFKGTQQIGTRDAAAEAALLEKIEVTERGLQQAKKGEERRRLGSEMERLTAEAEKYVVKEEFSRIYSQNGASNLNATTSQDLTSYFVSLPNTKLKLWAYLEANRLRDPVFREFYTEREVVQEERRTRVDDSPFGKLYEALMEISFVNSPYRRPTIGYSQDLEKLTATDLREFYNRYYAPANMVGAVVGNIDLTEAEGIIRENFAALPAKPPPPALSFQEPAPRAPKRVTVPFDASPSLVASFQKPTMPHPDDYIFDVLNQVLCEGDTSRLSKRLVEKDRLVQKIGCTSSAPGARLDNAFFIYAAPLPGHSTEEILKTVQDEFRRVREEGVGEAELARAKKNLIADWYYDMQSNEDLAELLSYFEILGDWRYIFEHQKQVQSVTSADLVRVVETYLRPERIRVAVLQPVKRS
jgi:predicted Zn-dependent peptidase